VSTPPSAHVAAWLPAVVDAAAAAGVRRVAVLSVLPRDGSAAAYGEWFRSMEGALGVAAPPPPRVADGGGLLPPPPAPPRRPGVCVLRAAMFFENLLAAAPAVRATGVLVGVAPATAVTPYVAVADVGAAAAAVLLTATPPPSGGGGPGDAPWPHAGAVYELIGDAPDGAAVAAALAAVVARPPGGGGAAGGSGGGGGDGDGPRRPTVVYEQVDEAAAVAAAVAAGAPEWAARSLTELAAATAAGRVRMTTASGDLGRLLGGKGGMTVADWVASTAALWAAPPA